MIITIRHGFESVNLDFDHTPTVGEVRRHTGARMQAGFKENDRALVNGVEQPDEAQLSNGTTVVFETRANSKALPVLA